MVKPVCTYFIISEQRCDGFPDCSDGTDETYCQNKDIVIKDESYEKNKIFKDDKKKINCFLNLTIFDVISIDGDNNLFKPTFEISVKWKDQRLKFQHMKKGLQRLLPNEELDKIWNPILMLDDINQNYRWIA